MTAFFGGQLAVLIGIRNLFLLVAALLLLNACWCRWKIVLPAKGKICK